MMLMVLVLDLVPVPVMLLLVMPLRVGFCVGQQDHDNEGDVGDDYYG